MVTFLFSSIDKRINMSYVYYRLKPEEKIHMLFVKTKEQEKESQIIFEVLTRSPFNTRDFIMDKDLFMELFRCSAKNMINTNVSNEKTDIFECVDAKFIEKMYWWNRNIILVTPLYAEVYESSSKATIETFLNLNDFKSVYAEDLKGDAFDFSRDFKFFRGLFNTTKELVI